MSRHVALVRDRPALAALAPEWEALADRTGSGFATRPSYGTAWLDLTRHEPAVVVVRDEGGALRAVAPLHRRSVLGRPVLRWLGHGLGTVGTVVAEDPADAAAVWDALADRGAGLQLTHVLPGDPSVLALRRSPRWRSSVRLDERRPLLPLPAGTTSSDLRSSSSLQRLTRYRTAAARAGAPLALEVVTDLAGLQRRWPDIVRVAAAADADSARTNLCGPPWDAFTLDALSGEARGGRLLLVGLLAGDRWVAHEVGLRTGGTVELWLSRFDPGGGVSSPGHQLARDLVDRAGSLGVDALDFGIGENAYKHAWTTAAQDLGTLTAVPAPRRLGTLSAALSAQHALRRSAAQVLSALPGTGGR